MGVYKVVIVALTVVAVMTLGLTLGRIMSDQDSQSNQVVHLSVYYESLCPDSIRFVRRQLAPTWPQLRQYLNLTLVPFGKANFVKKSSGGWSFKCQHGSEECRGNMMMSCGLKYIQDDNLQVRFVSCVMSSRYPPDAGLPCARSLGVDYSRIQICTSGQEGEDLLHDEGVLTKALNPPLYYVPWITVNGKFSRDELQLAQTDLAELVCRYLKPPKPPVCGGH